MICLAVIRPPLFSLETLITPDLKKPAAVLVTVSSSRILLLMSGLARGSFPPSVDLPVDSQQLVGGPNLASYWLLRNFLLLDRLMTVAEEKISLSSSLPLPALTAAVAAAAPHLLPLDRVLSVARVERVFSLRLVVTAREGSVLDRVELLQRLSANPTR